MDKYYRGVVQFHNEFFTQIFIGGSKRNKNDDRMKFVVEKYDRHKCDTLYSCTCTCKEYSYYQNFLGSLVTF